MEAQIVKLNTSVFRKNNSTEYKKTERSVKSKNCIWPIRMKIKVIPCQFKEEAATTSLYTTHPKSEGKQTVKISSMPDI